MRKTRYGQFLLTGRAVVATSEYSTPYSPPIDGCKQIVDCHAEVGIETCLEIDKYIYGRHHHADEPQLYAGIVLKIEIDKPAYRAQGVEGKQPVH